MGDHDNAYKNLFSHPQVVRDFLRGYVAEPWVDELDFDTLEKVRGPNAKFGNCSLRRNAQLCVAKA